MGSGLAPCQASQATGTTGAPAGKLFPSNPVNKENNCVEATHQMVRPKLRHAHTQDNVAAVGDHPTNIDGPPEHQMEDEETLLDASINAAGTTNQF